MANHDSDLAVPLFDLTAQWRFLAERVSAAVLRVLSGTTYIGGPELAALESSLGAFLTAEVVAVSSGTDALLASLMALEIGPGDEVVTTPFSFFATAGGIRRTGATPIFADINAETFLMDAAAARAAATPKTRAVMPVHLFGQMADMEAFSAVAEAANCPLIEDAAQAIGARDPHGFGIAEKSAAACLSFYPTKNLGAAGDAGAVVSRDAELAKMVRQLRQHGEVERYYHARVGGNFRMDAIQAAVLSVKLPYVNQWNDCRREIARCYTEGFAGSDVLAPITAPGAHHVFHQYVVRAPRRDDLRRHLAERRIGTGVFYPRPLHLQACFADLGHGAGAFPVAEKAAEEVLALPMYPELSERQCVRVIDAILEFYGGG